MNIKTVLTHLGCTNILIEDDIVRFQYKDEFFRVDKEKLENYLGGD